MKKEQKKEQSQSRGALGIFVAAGIVLGVFVCKAIGSFWAAHDSFGSMLLSYAVLCIWICVSLFLQLIIHETGHLVFGLLSGYRFSSFRIGSFMWMKVNGKLVCKKLTVAGTGGQCLMIPPELQDGKIPVLMYNLGGSIMNLVVGAVFFALYLLTRQNVWVSGFCLAMAMLGVTVALMNGIPLKLGMVDNDGYNALNLGKDTASMHGFWMQLKLNDELAKGKRLRDMPEEWFAVPSDEEMKNGLVAAQGVFATNRLMDRQHFEQADQLIAHMLTLDSGIVGLHRNLMLCDRLYCELIRENRREVIEKLHTKDLQKFMKTMKDYPSVIRTEYAYALLALKDMEKAEQIRKHFEKIGETHPYPGDVQSEQDMMKIAETAANTKA